MGQLKVLLWSWIETTRNLGRGRIWGPFLLLVVIQWAFLLLLTQFHRTILAPVLVPWIRLVVGEGAMGYPVYFAALPTIYNAAGILIDIFFGAWLLGAGFLLFWQADRPADPGTGGIQRARSSYWSLLLARLPLALLIVGLLILLPRLVLGSVADVPGTLVRAIRYGSIVVASALECLFLYAPLAILVERRRPLDAIRRSMSLAAGAPLATFGAVLVPNLIQVPISALFRRSDTIVRNMAPEVVAWLLALSVLLYAVAAFYMAGSGARLFRIRTEGAAR